MRAAAALFVILVPLAASAGPGEAPVIGGTDAPAGKWPDVAAVYFDDHGTPSQECTGTLIAPTVVITAGHCNDPADSIDQVLVGTNSLVKQQEGEVIAVTKTIEYPSSQQSFDVSVLVLAKASTREPRPIATGWASLEIKNGAQVSIVGYGAIDKDANMYVNELKEATTTITDADCTINKNNGCVAAAMPAGELGAGGMGIDTCPGDSGGPLYLPTDFGTFLAGVTSRGYDDAQFYCSEGGIYVRPDKIVDWMEKETGVGIARGPEPSVPKLLSGVRGHAIDEMIDANDPKSEKHHFAITAQGKYSTAAVNDDGKLRVCTDPGVVAQDKITLTIADANDATRVLTYTIPIDIMDGDPASSCDVNAFGGDSGGCCDASRSAGGAVPLGAGVLLAALRRRRRR